MRGNKLEPYPLLVVFPLQLCSLLYESFVASILIQAQVEIRQIKRHKLEAWAADSCTPYWQESLLSHKSVLVAAKYPI
jgi:hypothetical protein